MSAQEKFWFESQHSELVAYLEDLLAPAVVPVVMPVRLVPPETPVILPFPVKETLAPSMPAPSIEVLSPAEPERPVLPVLNGFKELSCLYIVCDGIRYALPLIHLGRIFRATQHLTPLIGQPAWQLGLLPTTPVQQVISLHYLLTGQVGRAPDYFVSVALSRRVLACEAILHSERISAEAVHWRQDRDRLPLIAGVITENLVPLLDLSGLEERLK